MAEDTADRNQAKDLNHAQNGSNHFLLKKNLKPFSDQRHINIKELAVFQRKCSFKGPRQSEGKIPNG